MTNKDFLLSVIVPVYNEEEGINILIETLLPVLAPYNYELLFVNDGSKDKTAAIIKQIAQKNNRIKLITFVRNFGHQMALTAGYEMAKGDAVVTIDADLQDPPNLIPKMVDEWQGGAKIVYAKREERHEGFFKRKTASFFYWLINSLSATPIPPEVGDYRLIDKSVVEVIKKMPEKSRFLRGLVAWGGHEAAYITFSREERKAGQTHYPVSKMMAFAFDGITSFSTKPLRIATYLGFITSIVGAIGVSYAIYRRLFLPHDYWVTGWTSVFVGVMFFGGVQLITIGIIGEYIGKIYEQVKGRPMYLVAEKVNI